MLLSMFFAHSLPFLLAQISRCVGSDSPLSQLNRAVVWAQIPAAIMGFVCMPGCSKKKPPRKIRVDVDVISSVVASTPFDEIRYRRKSNAR